MSKVVFQIGFTDHVLISLPSKMAGDGDTLTGKAKVRVGPLVCSQRIQIKRNDLLLFFRQVEQTYRSLKGEFSLISDYRAFVLQGEMTVKGHAKISVWMSGRGIHIPDDAYWNAEANYTCDAEALKRVLAAKSAI